MPTKTPDTDHEQERLYPGTDTGTAKPEPKGKPTENDAALPGSPNSDLRGPKPDRGPRGMST